MGWRDNAIPDRDGFGLGGLQAGESVSVTFLDDGRQVETEYGEAVQIGVVVHDIPNGYAGMNDEPIEADGETEYNLMTSSGRLQYALAQHTDNLSGESVEITAEGDAESFDRTYIVD